MVKYILLISAFMVAGATASLAEKREFVDHNGILMDHGGGHLMDMGGGMVMGQNIDTLPGGCKRISKEVEITVRAGRKYAQKFPGRMFAFDQQEFNFNPCTKLTVHFVNEDNIRHQFMVHGLPKYIYPQGMFHLEVTGPGKISGTLILPPEDKTYLVHCDLAQHMEKGMKGQIKVGKGSGDLPSIPGLTDYVISDDYSVETAAPAAAPSAAVPSVAAPAAPERKAPLISGLWVIGLAVGLFGAAYAMRKFKGMSAGQIAEYLWDRTKDLLSFLAKWTNRLIRFLLSLRESKKALPGK